MNRWLNWKPKCSNSKLAEMEQDEFSNDESECFEKIQNQSLKEASQNARKVLFPEEQISDSELKTLNILTPFVD